MRDAAGDRVAVGVWVGWDFPVHFVGEGMARLLGMLVEGAAESGRVVFHVCVRPVNAAAARQMLEGLRAQEGTDWTLHLIEDVAPPRHPRLSSLPPGTAALLEMPDARIGQRLFLAGLAGAPFLLLRNILRPLWRLAIRSGLGLALAARRDPVGAAPEIAIGLRRLPLPAFRRLADALAAWAAARREEMAPANGAPPCPAPSAGAPKPEPEPEPEWHLPGLDPARVDAWLGLMADMVVPEAIPGRRAMLLPDAMMLDFSAAWNPAELTEDGAILGWFPRVRRNAALSDAILTFSTHVARRHAVEGLGADPAKLRIVPHAPPDLRPALPFLPADRRRTAATRAEAAALLRRHAAVRGWDYLADFPLEHVDYIAVSTQERPSKNLPVMIEALRILVQERGGTLKLLMTTAVINDPATPFLRLHRLIREHGLMLDAIPVPRLPETEHAALYHAAALTVHPAFFEGGDAPFPFSESVSVGTPCLMARGPHTEELLAQRPELAPFVFDPHDAEALAGLIARGIAGREAMLDVQLAAHAGMRERGWARVAEEYAAAATGIPLVPVRRLEG